MRSVIQRFAILLLLGVLALPVGASEEIMSIGPEGSILQLRSGLYGELFPDGAEAPPDHQVLALDIVRSESVERFLVPGTESMSEESLARILYDPTSGNVHLLWKGLSGPHPLLYLTSFDGLVWGATIEITGSVFANKGDPQLVISRDDPILDYKAGEGGRDNDRRVIYVTWWENAAVGSFKRFAPLLFLGGEYLGRAPIYNLENLVGDEQKAGQGVDVDDRFENLLRIQPASNGHSAVLGYLSRETGRVVSLEVDMLPAVLSELASRVRDLILEHGLEMGPSELADFIHAAILELGADFHPGSLHYLADQTRELIIAGGIPFTPGTLPPFADKAGVHIIHIGSRFKSNGLEAPQAVKILEISDPEDGTLHHFRVSVLADREPPSVSGDARLYLSRNGRESLVAWEEDGAIFYVESDGDFWKGEQSIALSDTLDRASAFKILEEYILNR